MTSANLILGVRAEVGKVAATSGELEDADITRQSLWILDLMADRFPIKILRSITTVANQRTYDVNTNTRTVVKVYPPGTVDDQVLDLGNRIVSGGFAEGNEYYNFPSMWKIRMARKVHGMPRFKWQFDMIQRKIVIDPKPETAGDTYWYSSVEKSQWILANVPSEFEYLLTIGTAWKALEQIVLKRDTLGGVQRAGGMVDYPAARLDTYIERKKKDFFTELNTKVQLYNRG